MEVVPGWSYIHRTAPTDSAPPGTVADLITANLQPAVTGCATAIRRFLAGSTPGAIVNAFDLIRRDPARRDSVPRQGSTVSAQEIATENVPVFALTCLCERRTSGGRMSRPVTGSVVVVVVGGGGVVVAVVVGGGGGVASVVVGAGCAAAALTVSHSAVSSLPTSTTATPGSAARTRRERSAPRWSGAGSLPRAGRGSRCGARPRGWGGRVDPVRTSASISA